MTMVRGRTVMRDGELVGTKGHGEYLTRERSPLAQAAQR
jgi:dihydropyrimidinase